MIDINELRQNITTYGLEATCADDLLTLLDRLEAAEKSDAESLAMYRRARDGRGALRAEIEELHVLIAAVKKRADAEFCLRVKKEEEYTRLRAKLEEAEKERDDVAQQLVQSEIGKREISEAHDALQVEVGKLKGLEVSRCVKINGYIVDNARLAEEVERLQAKIEQMERQRPFAWIVRGGYPVPLENLEWQLLCGAERPTLSWTNQEMRPLYALPGAQTQGEGK